VNCDRKSDIVIIRASGTISNSLRQYLSNIVRKQDIEEIQNTAIWTLHTCFGKY